MQIRSSIHDHPIPSLSRREWLRKSSTTRTYNTVLGGKWVFRPWTWEWFPFRRMKKPGRYWSWHRRALVCWWLFRLKFIPGLLVAKGEKWCSWQAPWHLSRRKFGRWLVPHAIMGKPTNAPISKHSDSQTFNFRLSNSRFLIFWDFFIFEIGFPPRDSTPTFYLKWS